MVAKWNMKKGTTANNTPSSHWILYRDGKIIYTGFRQGCFNMILRDNPVTDAPVEVVKPQEDSNSS